MMERLTYFDGVSYTALSSKNECVQKLGELEDLQEQGRLVELPVEVGSELCLVWGGKVEKRIVTKTEIDGICYTLNDSGWLFHKHYKNIAFKTQEEAEKALEEMGCK